MADTLSTEDARAIDLIRASGALNPNLTLDKLMDVTRQLAELEPGAGAEPDGRASMTFIGAFYVYKKVQL
jgi:hypothetical protein